MAYTNPFKIKNGLVLDFTLSAADTALDAFLGRNSDGEITSFTGIPANRVSSAGNLTESTSSVLTITGGTGAVLSGLTIQVKLAGAGQSGYLSSTDWNTFNNKIGGTLASGSIFVGNGSGAPTATDTISIGDILGNTGTGLTIKAGVVTNSMVATGAAISRSKTAAGTAYRIIANNNTGVMSENAAITASRVVVSDSNGQLIHSNITTTQINNILSTIVGLSTSSLVTAPTGSEDGYAITWDNGNSRWTLIDPVVTGLPTGGTTGQFIIKDSGTNFDVSWTDLLLANVTDVSATAAEINILSGVTTSSAQLNFSNTLSGNIQDQLDSKLSTALTQYYMFVGNASNIATPFATGANGYVLTSVGGVPTWVSPGSGGTVTSVAGSGGTTGLSFSGSPITTSGTLTLGGTLVVANGGTGLTATTVGGLLLGTSTSAFTNLPIGANTYVLTSNGTTASWAAPSGGGLTVGTTTITSGTDTYALYNNAGVLGNRAVTGTGNSVLSTSPTLVTPVLGTPTSVTLTNATGLPPTTGISGWPSNASGVLTNNGSGTLTWGAGGVGTIASNDAYFIAGRTVVPMAASGSGNYSIPHYTEYNNKTILVVETQFMAMKSDGTAAAFATVTSMFRKDNSGTWTVDTAGTSTTSNATTIVSITGAINGGVPGIYYICGAFSGTYAGAFTTKSSSYQY